MLGIGEGGSPKLRPVFFSDARHAIGEVRLLRHHRQLFRLPLIDGDGRACQFVQQVFPVQPAPHERGELRAADALAAGGGEQDCAAGFDDLSGRRDALDRLIERQIERISSRSGNHRVGGLVQGRQCGCAHEFDAAREGRFRITREDGGDAAITGQRHVDHEIVPGHGRDLTELAMQRVLGKRALHRIGVSHEQRAVEPLDRLLAGQADRDQLAPARKTGHQMRLDEPEGDVEVGFDKSPVRVDGRSRSGFSQISLFVLLLGAMGIDRVAGKDLGADDLVELALGRLTVESGGDEDADLRGGYPGPLEGADHDRQDGTVRSRASNVADGDRRRTLAGCHCLEWRASDRLPERRFQHRLRVVKGLCEARLQDIHGQPRGQLDLRARLVESECYFHPAGILDTRNMLTDEPRGSPPDRGWVWMRISSTWPLESR